jgi:hypothetical protein
VAGFLAFSEKSAFPSLQTVAFVGFPIMEITVAGTAQVFHLIPFLLRWSTGVSPNPLQRYNIFPIHQHDCRFFSWNGAKTRNPFTKGRTVGMTAVQNAVDRRFLSQAKTAASILTTPCHHFSC